MCSIVEDDFGDEGGQHAMTEEKKPENDLELPDEICKKCNTEKVAVKLYLKDPQCVNCFLVYTRHKFRATLGASKIVKRGANVLIIFDGSAENVVMMDMIKYGLEQEQYRKLNFQPFVLFLDEFCLKNTKKDRNLSKIKELIKNFAFTTYYGSIGSVKYCKIDDIEEIQTIQNEEEIYLSTLNSIKSKTSQQDFIVQTRNRIYKTIAKKLNCGYIFISEISVDLAKQFLIEIALGRGASIADSIGFCDNREPDKKVLKPMRDLLTNEIIEYIKLRNLEYIEQVDQYSDGPSIQNLTSGFVDYLQENFPSTVSTVFRTGDAMGSSAAKKNLREDNLPNSTINDCNENFIQHFKKSLKVDANLETNKLCWLCKSKVDNENSFALDAQEFSKYVSTHMESEMPTSNSNDKHILCHGCRNIFEDLDD